MAIKEQDKVFYEELANGDKVINLPVTRANNVEGLGRSANTAYVVGDVVYVDNNKKVALKCTQTGTTSSSELDVSSNAIGSTVTDGGVVWQVCNRTSDVTSVNGKTGDVVLDVGVTSVNIKTGAVTLKESPSDMTEYIIESYRNGTEWYEVYKSGKVRQGGCGTKSSTQVYGVDITFLKPFANTDYTIIGISKIPTQNNCGVSAFTFTNKTTTMVEITIAGGWASHPSTGYNWIAEGQGA